MGFLVADYLDRLANDSYDLAIDQLACSKGYISGIEVFLAVFQAPGLHFYCAVFVATVFDLFILASGVFAGCFFTL